MGAPLICADNIGNVNLYPNVVVTDQSGGVGPTGFEAWRAFRGSRNIYSFWQPGATNTLAWLQLQHPDQVRAASFCAVSYGHNLAGFPVNIKGSSDGATFATLVAATIPTVPGGLISSPNGVLTEMGDWLVLIPNTPGFAYWRLEIPAMGSGKQPLVPSVQLGLAYQPLTLYRPRGEHRTKLTSQLVTTPLGWIGRGTRGLVRVQTLNLRADVNDYEYGQARLQVEELFGGGRPMWCIEDQDRSSEAFCAVRPDNEQGFVRPPRMYWPEAAIQVVEHEPLPLT